MNDNWPTNWIAKIALSIFVLALSAQAQQNPPTAAPALPPPNDTARFLAGMPVPENSPLAPLTRDPAWQEHSAFFENAFAKLNLRQLQKLRLWETTYLPEANASMPVAFYMFSGPDFLYATTSAGRYNPENVESVYWSEDETVARLEY